MKKQPMTTSILTYLANEGKDLYIQRHYKDHIEKHYKLSRPNVEDYTYLDLIKFKDGVLGEKSMFLLKNRNLILEVTPKKEYLFNGKVNVKKLIEDFNKGVDTTEIFELDAYSFDISVFDRTAKETNFRRVSKELCRKGIVSLDFIPFIPLSQKEEEMEEIALTADISKFNDKAKLTFKEYREYQTLDNWERVKVYL